MSEPGEYDEPPTPRTGLLVGLAVAWLAAILWTAHASIAVSGAGVGLINAAIALPNVVSACLLAGGAVGLTAAARLGDRSPGALIGAGAVGGLVVGALAAAYTLLNWGVGGPVTALAVMFAVAGVLGGVLAAALPRAVAVAGLLATLAVFVIWLGSNFAKESFVGLFSPAEAQSANGYFLALVALVGAIAAGLLAFWHLRRSARLGAGVPARWPVYLAAGLLPGAILLLAEAITRIGGARLVALAAAGSEIDRYRFADAAGSRLNHALVVLFLGGITAMIAFGRTLPRRQPQADPADQADRADRADRADERDQEDADDEAEPESQPVSRSSSDTSYHSSS